MWFDQICLAVTKQLLKCHPRLIQGFSVAHVQVDQSFGAKLLSRSSKGPCVTHVHFTGSPLSWESNSSLSFSIFSIYFHFALFISVCIFILYGLCAELCEFSALVRCDINKVKNFCNSSEILLYLYRSNNGEFQGHNFVQFFPSHQRTQYSKLTHILQLCSLH